jgi:hypothetical protein
MRTTRSAIRRTALFYLLMGLPGLPALLSLQGRFLVRGDPAATAQRISESVTTYRLMVLGDLVTPVGFLLLAWSLDCGSCHSASW